MKVMILTNSSVADALIDWLNRIEDEVEVAGEKFTVSLLRASSPDFIISYNYRHIISKDIISVMPDKIINLHISFLPWNKGADPNLWSIIDKTPKGVTIHKIDEGIDTGDILVQEEIVVSENESLAGSYTLLHEVMLEMFKNNWRYLRERRVKPVRQPMGGSVHIKKDLEKFLPVIEKYGYGISVKDFYEKCAEIINNDKS